MIATPTVSSSATEIIEYIEHVTANGMKAKALGADTAADRLLDAAGLALALLRKTHPSEAVAFEASFTQ